MGKCIAFWTTSASATVGSSFLHIFSDYPRVKGMEQLAELSLCLWCTYRALLNISYRQTDCTSILETKAWEKAGLRGRGQQLQVLSYRAGKRTSFKPLGLLCFYEPQPFSEVSTFWLTHEAVSRDACLLFFQPVLAWRHLGIGRKIWSQLHLHPSLYLKHFSQH